MSVNEELEFYTKNAEIFNCYSFALGSRDFEDGWGMPGFISRYNWGFYDDYISKENINNAIIADGAIFAGQANVPEQREGYYIIAAVVAPKDDFHFYRQMEDGSWWHDIGHGAPINVDASGNAIENPHLADRHYTYADYNQFVGYYYIPNTGLDVDKFTREELEKFPKPT